MGRASHALIAASFASVVGFFTAHAAASEAHEQVAQALFGGACPASVTRTGGPSAARDAVPFSAPVPGTRYVAGSGYFQILNVDGMTVKTVNAAKLSTTWYAGIIYSDHQIDKSAAEAIWPLEIGKMVTFLEQAGDDGWCHTVSILRNESIVLPAGSFATIVIEDSMHSLRDTQGNVNLTRTFWYAPSAHWVVKRDVRQISGPLFRTAPYALTQIIGPAPPPRLAIVDPKWPKIDCGDAHIDLPFTQPHDCYHGPMGKGDQGMCHAENYGAAGGDATIEFEVFLALAGGRCGIYFAGDDIQDFAESATARSRNGTNFSAMKRRGNAQVVNFTGKSTSGPLDCFAFARIGPTLHRDDKLYRYTLRSHVCRVDGTKLGEAEIDQLARAIGVD